HFTASDVLLIGAASQRLFCVLRGKRDDWLHQLSVRTTTADEPNVGEITAAICLQRLDLRLVVGEVRFVPVQPQSPAVWHGVGQLDVHDAASLPVPSPPGGRV